MAWDKIKSAATSANAAYKTASHVKQTASDIKQNGLVNTVKDRINRKARKKMRSIGRPYFSVGCRFKRQREFQRY